MQPGCFALGFLLPQPLEYWHYQCVFSACVYMLPHMHVGMGEAQGSPWESYVLILHCSLS